LLLTLPLTLSLTLTENEGFSPEFIYERARLRALSSKNDFKDFDFNNLILKNLTLPPQNPSKTRFSRKIKKK
jgi:hypothetical protein